MALPPVVNSTNILQATVFDNFLSAKITNINLKHKKAAQSTFEYNVGEIKKPWGDAIKKFIPSLGISY